ncbi:DinB family protein, partial [Burkholderia gladioli]|nr:DinB family protein [Burkholderia gladioli]
MTKNELTARTLASTLEREIAAVRRHSLELASPLSSEDQVLQSMPDASPTKWHLAHTTWFFETVILARHAPGYTPFDERYAYLFNSYYEALGPRHARPRRGMLSRPSLEDVLAYRHHVETALLELVRGADLPLLVEIAPEITLGLNHEQQHQELLLTDILHAFSVNPLLPAYRDDGAAPRMPASPAGEARWLAHAGGIVEIGHDGGGFAFDNEGPRHQALLRPFEIAAPDNFARTGNRRDLAVPPPAPTVLDKLARAGGQVIAIGKISDIYAGMGVTRKIKANGLDGLWDATLAAARETPDFSLVMTNFVDFDQNFGH